MSATLSELISIIHEGIKAKAPDQEFVIGPALDNLAWLVKSGRAKDIDLSDTLRFKELIKSISKNEQPKI